MKKENANNNYRKLTSFLAVEAKISDQTGTEVGKSTGRGTAATIETRVRNTWILSCKRENKRKKENNRSQLLEK